MAKCETFEQFANLMLQQITEALGIAGGITIDDIRAEWRAIPVALDQAETFARGLQRPMPGDEEDEGLLPVVGMGAPPPLVPPPAGPT